MKNLFLRMASDLLWMMYPTLCAACGKPLFANEECICTPCRYHLPRTGFHLEKVNPVAKQFWGKVRIEFATAYLYFNKGERVQRLIHQLKYKGNKEAGVYIGKSMGTELRHSPFSDIDVIVPVPLHRSRLKKRGYNQSECFADGLAEGMNKEVSVSSIIRKEATETQTRKHRYERYKNVKDIFELTTPGKLEGKKILLVDDVLTTGSTLVSCAETILQVPSASIYIAAIACA